LLIDPVDTGFTESLLPSKESGSIPVTIDKEDFRQRYPWTYQILTTRLNKRYTDFQHYAKGAVAVILLLGAWLGWQIDIVKERIQTLFQ